MKKILVVDDDAELRANLSEILRDAGFAADEISEGRGALNMIQTKDFDIVLLDLMMPGMNGMEILSEIKKIRPNIKVVMMTAFATVNNAVDAIKKGASDYVSKPFKIEGLLSILRRVMEEARFESNIRNLDLENTLNSLTNSIRRGILYLLYKHQEMRLMEITRRLKIEDHTKVVFHLRLLKESGIIKQNKEKSYSLTKDGEKMIDLLKLLENYLSSN